MCQLSVGRSAEDVETARTPRRHGQSVVIGGPGPAGETLGAEGGGSPRGAVPVLVAEGAFVVEGEDVRVVLTPGDGGGGLHEIAA